MGKVLYLQWDCFGEEYICDSFKKAGLTVEKYPIPYGKMALRSDEAFETALKQRLESGCDFVFSFNYFPAVAKACHEVGIKYVSWTYDSPFMYLYDASINLSTNLAFVFDKATVDELVQKGVKTLHYLPMAAPVQAYDAMYSSAALRKRYEADVAFVGSLYTEKRQDQMRRLKGINDATRQYLDTIMGLQLQSYAMPILEQFLKSDIIGELRRVCPISLEEGEMQTEAWMYANYFMARKVTAIERTTILNQVGQVYRLKLYTPEPTPQFPHIENMGPVDYCEGMPYVFKNSKINLNISLKSIYTGIPLRAFDIMGCGGFLISDFQQDFGEFFVPGEDYVFYTTFEDLYSKIDYYMEHEEERIAIAKSGCEKVKAAHTYDHRVEKILSML